MLIRGILLLIVLVIAFIVYKFISVMMKKSQLQAEDLLRNCKTEDEYNEIKKAIMKRNLIKVILFYVIFVLIIAILLFIIMMGIIQINRI